VESDLQDISYESSAFNRARTSVAIGAKMADKHESKTKKLMAAHEKRDFNQLDDFLFTVADCSRWPRHLPLSNGRKTCW
jgi:hypothetical protein